MTRAQINRTVVESIVRRSFREIQRDPKRAIRNLVDLGLEAADGQFQKKFLDMAHGILKRENSPYYTLIQNTVQSVDEDRLMSFGMALGWNSLTQGAKRIRTEEAQRGHNIPWSMTLHMKAGPGDLSMEDYLRLAQEGTKLGIYSYFLFAEDVPSVQMALEISAANRNCAFCLLLPADLEVGMLSQAAIPLNMFLGVDSSAQDWEEQVRYFRDRRCPYLIYRTYSGKEDVEEIISGHWMERILPWAGIAALLIAQGDAGAADVSSVYSYVLDARIGQRYPTLALDFYRDNLYVDVCVSQDPCFLGVLPDGTITEYKQGREVPMGDSILSKPLAEQLRRFSKPGTNF